MTNILRVTAAQRNALEAALDEAGLSPVALVDDAVATLVGHLFTAGGIDAVHGAAGSYLVRHACRALENSVVR